MLLTAALHSINAVQLGRLAILKHHACSVVNWEGGGATKGGEEKKTMRESLGRKSKIDCANKIIIELESDYWEA